MAEASKPRCQTSPNYSLATGLEVPATVHRLLHALPELQEMHPFRMSKGFLWLVSFILIMCWIGVLYEQNFDGKGAHIIVHQDSLFIGLSILLAACIIAINFSTRESNDRLPSDYIKFISKIRDETLSHEQLVKEVGETSEYVYKEDGPGKNETCLSKDQKKSLEHLIYEGKIILREGQYSLPERCE